MDTKQEKNQKKTKNKIGKIIGIIIAIIVIVFAVICLIFNLNKPSAKEALTTASSTKINSARAEIIVKQTSGKKQTARMNYEFNKELTHVSTKFSPDTSTNSQNMWASSKKIYVFDNNKWSYIQRSGFASTVYTQILDGYQELFTAHNFKKFTDAGFKPIKVTSNGLNGYTLSYNGSNKALLKGLQSASTVSGSTDKTDINQIKNVDLTIKVSRKKELQEMKYTVTYKNNAGVVSVHLYDINQTNNLTLPNSAKKASRMKVPNIEN